MEDGNAAEHKQNIPEILQRLLDLIDETLDFTEYSAAVMHYSQAYQALSACLKPDPTPWFKPERFIENTTK